MRLALGREENFYLQVFGALTPCFVDVLLLMIPARVVTAARERAVDRRERAWR